MRAVRKVDYLKYSVGIMVW